VEVDTVILAVGQEPDLSSLPEDLVSDSGLIKADSGTTQTSRPYVFAAGDAVRGSASVAQAVAGGKRAAQAMTLYLKGVELEWLPALTMPVTGALPEKAQMQRSKRHEKVLAVQGSSPFQEKYAGFDLVQTLAEADRCMTCGAKSVAAHLDDCMTCFTCELSCPVEAILVHPFKEILPRSLRLLKP
jgi:NAD-dependent dihydropyrimidine dehydrogenase PreA subunit